MEAVVRQFEQEPRKASFFNVKDRRYRYAVEVRAVLTSEEMQIVRQHKLMNVIVCKAVNLHYKEAKEREDYKYMTKDPHPVHTYWIADFIKGFVLDFPSPTEAENWAILVRDDLKNIKNMIESRAVPFGKTDTFKL